MVQLFRSSSAHQAIMAAKMLGNILIWRELVCSLEAYGDESIDNVVQVLQLARIESVIISNYSNLTQVFQDSKRRLKEELHLTNTDGSSAPEKTYNSFAISIAMHLCGQNFPVELPTILKWGIISANRNDLLNYRLKCFNGFLSSVVEEGIVEFLQPFTMDALPKYFTPLMRRSKSSYASHHVDCMKQMKSYCAESDSDEGEGNEKDGITQLSKMIASSNIEEYALMCRWGRGVVFGLDKALISKLYAVSIQVLQNLLNIHDKDSHLFKEQLYSWHLCLATVRSITMQGNTTVDQVLNEFFFFPILEFLLNKLSHDVNSHDLNFVDIWKSFFVTWRQIQVLSWVEMFKTNGLSVLILKRLVGYCEFSNEFCVDFALWLRQVFLSFFYQENIVEAILLILDGELDSFAMSFVSSFGFKDCNTDNALDLSIVSACFQISEVLMRILKRAIIGLGNYQQTYMQKINLILQNLSQMILSAVNRHINTFKIHSDMDERKFPVISIFLTSAINTYLSLEHLDGSQFDNEGSNIELIARYYQQYDFRFCNNSNVIPDNSNLHNLLIGLASQYLDLDICKERGSFMLLFMLNVKVSSKQLSRRYNAPEEIEVLIPGVVEESFSINMGATKWLTNKICSDYELYDCLINSKSMQPILRRLSNFCETSSREGFCLLLSIMMYFFRNLIGDQDVPVDVIVDICSQLTGINVGMFNNIMSIDYPNSYKKIKEDWMYVIIPTMSSQYGEKWLQLLSKIESGAAFASMARPVKLFHLLILTTEDYFSMWFIDNFSTEPVYSLIESYLSLLKFIMNANRNISYVESDQVVFSELILQNHLKRKGLQLRNKQSINDSNAISSFYFSLKSAILNQMVTPEFQSVGIMFLLSSILPVNVRRQFFMDTDIIENIRWSECESFALETLNFFVPIPILNPSTGHYRFYLEILNFARRLPKECILLRSILVLQLIIFCFSVAFQIFLEVEICGADPHMANLIGLEAQMLLQILGNGSDADFRKLCIDMILSCYSLWENSFISVHAVSRILHYSSSNNLRALMEPHRCLALSCLVVTEKDTTIQFGDLMNKVDL